MARRTLTRREFFSLAGMAGLGALAGCSRSEAPAPSDDALERATVLDEAAPDELAVLAIGDVLVHQRVWESGVRADGTRAYDHLFAQVADDVVAADVAVVGQETILGGEGLVQQPAGARRRRGRRGL